MNIRQELYERIAHIVETKPTIKGKVHIVDMTNDLLPCEIGAFKAYHSDGYCFSVWCETEEDGIYYWFNGNYSGFKSCDEETSLQLIKDLDNGL